MIGTVLLFGGTYAVRAMVFPLVLLFFMIPIPAVIYNRITFPLQLFASEVAAHTLEFIGIPVLRDGNVLELASQKLSVVEACSGIRSLLSLTFLSLVYGYFFDTKRWMRVVLFFATIPIAILANAGKSHSNRYYERSESRTRPWRGAHGIRLGHIHDRARDDDHYASSH